MYLNFKNCKTISIIYSNNFKIHSKLSSYILYLITVGYNLAIHLWNSKIKYSDVSNPELVSLSYGHRLWFSFNFFSSISKLSSLPLLPRVYTCGCSQNKRKLEVVCWRLYAGGWKLELDFFWRTISCNKLSCKSHAAL